MMAPRAESAWREKLVSEEETSTAFGMVTSCCVGVTSLVASTPTSVTVPWVLPTSTNSPVRTERE